MKNKLYAYINENLNNTKLFGFKKAKVDTERCCGIGALFDEETIANSSVSNYIQNNVDDSKFQKVLFGFIDKKELKDSDVYKRVHIDRRLFSKIRNEEYHPSKETVILLGLALELNEKEFDKLITSASYSLPKNNVFDLIIRFCFVEGIYNLKDVNELLDSYNCKLFAY